MRDKPNVTTAVRNFHFIAGAAVCTIHQDVPTKRIEILVDHRCEAGLHLNIVAGADLLKVCAQPKHVGFLRKGLERQGRS
jgi:hypothetical protein